MACNQEETKSEYACECGQILIDHDNRVVANKIESGDHNGIIACPNPNCQKQYRIIYNACKTEKISPISTKTI
ncbi:MAG TPA: hypothetical protein PKN62_03105 [bacterium]|mgnify:CR=1 FL=1|nr:hypothetical protein [bacterium]